MSKQSQLTTLVGSRICHDLISPLGAIGNGIELMSLSGIANTPEFALIEESVQAANARIKFFRLAYGAAAEGQMLSRAEVAGTLASVARGGKLTYFWTPEGDQPKDMVRLAFLLLQCFESAMPYGGEITISRDERAWTAVAEAERLKIDVPLWDMLMSPRARRNVAPGQVQFALLPEVLIETGRTLALKLTETRIEARF